MTEILSEVSVPTDHPAFAGHFPSRPLLPGVVLLSEVMEALERHPALKHALGHEPTIEVAKFMSPVGPGESLRIVLSACSPTLPRASAGEAPATCRVDFTVSCGARTIAKGRLSGCPTP